MISPAPDHIDNYLFSRSKKVIVRGRHRVKTTKNPSNVKTVIFLLELKWMIKVILIYKVIY